VLNLSGNYYLKKRMDIINSLKSRMGEAEEAKLSQFLGENKESVEKSLTLTLSTMLGGLKEIATRDGDAAGIMKVISDGGHSGDLTDDLASLFNNSDKIQLLITIGKNINNHFFKNKVDTYVERIAKGGEISKTSASSLLSLSAPLVLGALGKNIKLESLNVTSFTSRLLDENLGSSYKKEHDIFASVQSTYSEPKVDDEQIETKEPRRTAHEKSGNSISWLAWLMLGLLGLAVAFYALKDKNLLSSDNLEIIEIPNDSTDSKTEEDVFDALNTENDKNTKVPETEEKTVVVQPSPAIIQPKVEPPKTVKSTVSEPVRNTQVRPTIAVVETENRSRTNNTSTTDTRPMSVKLNQSNTFFGINGLSFKNNSAEIANKGSLNTLVQYLKSNPTRKIQIAGTGTSGSLAEDRAYGLQGALFEQGIDVSQTEILKLPSSEDGPVVVKIR
jgi:outer membrane protein OmpA-like peptidoglycan-associated protein